MDKQELNYAQFARRISESATFLYSLKNYIKGKKAKYKFQTVLGEVVRRAALHTVAVDKLIGKLIGVETEDG